jgi:hypothetical protein
LDPEEHKLIGQLKHRYFTEVIEHGHATEVKTQTQSRNWGKKTQIPEVIETQSRNWFNRHKHITEVVQSQSRNWGKKH